MDNVIIDAEVILPISEAVSGLLKGIPAANGIIVAKSLGQPIAAASANLSGRPSPNSASAVYEDLNGRIKYILDGGKCRYSIESTVISMVGNETILIRPGVIDQTEIEKVLGKKILSSDKNLVRVNSSNQSAVHNINYKIYWTDSIDEIKSYLGEKNKQILLLISQKNIEKIDHNHKIILRAESLFESMRYAEKNNFDEVIVLFDNFVNNLEIIKHRLKFAVKLK